MLDCLPADPFLHVCSFLRAAHLSVLSGSCSAGQRLVKEHAPLTTLNWDKETPLYSFGNPEIMSRVCTNCKHLRHLSLSPATFRHCWTSEACEQLCKMLIGMPNLESIHGIPAAFCFETFSFARNNGGARRTSFAGHEAVFDCLACKLKELQFIGFEEACAVRQEQLVQLAAASSSLVAISAEGCLCFDENNLPRLRQKVRVPAHSLENGPKGMREVELICAEEEEELDEQFLVAEDVASSLLADDAYLYSIDASLEGKLPGEEINMDEEAEWEENEGPDSEWGFSCANDDYLQSCGPDSEWGFSCANDDYLQSCGPDSEWGFSCANDDYLQSCMNIEHTDDAL